MTHAAHDHHHDHADSHHHEGDGGHRHAAPGGIYLISPSGAVADPQALERARLRLAGLGFKTAVDRTALAVQERFRSEEHTSELQSLMRISYAVFCLKKKKNKQYKRYQKHTYESQSKFISLH